MTLNQFRGYLYRIAKYLGDVQAIRNGKIAKRIYRRTLGKILGRLFF